MMIAKIEWTQKQRHNHHKKWKYIITIDQQQQHRRLRTDSSLSHQGLKGILLVPKHKTR